MKNSYKIFAILLVSMIFIQSDFPAYKLYSNKGKEVKFSDFVDEAVKADVVLFGETHNNPVSHWLQLELLKAMHQKKPQELVAGGEMWEADEQLKIDEYFSGFITQKSFESEARLWDNYKTDYKPFLEYANEQKIPFVATNIPRRYASLVAYHGLDTLKYLSKDAKKFIAPLPIEVDLKLPGYKNMMHAGSGMKYLPHAQASKDATMAHFILENLKKGYTFLHINGSYHSNNYEGINWYLKQEKPKLKILTITTVDEENVDNISEENTKLADYIIVVNKNMTKTY